MPVAAAGHAALQQAAVVGHAAFLQATAVVVVHAALPRAAVVYRRVRGGPEQVIATRLCV